MATSATIWGLGDVSAQHLEASFKQRTLEPVAPTTARDTALPPGLAGIARAGTVQRLACPVEVAAGTGAAEGEGKWEIDCRRTTVQMVYAGVLWGPLGHYWYHFLDIATAKVVPLGTWRALAFKMGAEMTVLHPLSLGIFFVSLGLAHGNSLSALTAQLERDFVTTLVAEVVVLQRTNDWRGGCVATKE